MVADAQRYFLWAKEEVKRLTGVEFYLVGDEVYFNVLAKSRSDEVILLPDKQANWARISAFDALTCYNPYDSSKTEHAGPEGVEHFLNDVSKLYDYYRRVAAASGQRFIPGIIPGYDDRGVRPKAGHYVIPRLDREGQSVLGRAFAKWVAPGITADNPFAVVTSWNEWNEGTQIEPSQFSGEPGVKRSHRGSICSEPTWGESYGCAYLSELRGFTRNHR